MFIRHMLDVHVYCYLPFVIYLLYVLIEKKQIISIHMSMKSEVQFSIYVT